MSLQIQEVGEHGKYVRLVNPENHYVNMGGWVVRQSVDRLFFVTYTFPVDFVATPNSTVTVWSANAGAVSNPPDHIVMTDINWGIGHHHVVTTLYDNNKEKIARQEFPGYKNLIDPCNTDNTIIVIVNNEAAVAPPDDKLPENQS